MTHARIPRIHSADRRQCCDGLCQQGRYCPQVDAVRCACAVERGPRYGWFARFCDWLNKLAGL